MSVLFSTFSISLLCPIDQILTIDPSCYKCLHRILRGNLAPGGCVSKITGKEGLEFEGKARVFDNEDDVTKAIQDKTIKVGEKTVIVLRYLGPKGGPGTFLPLSFFMSRIREGRREVWTKSELISV